MEKQGHKKGNQKLTRLTARMNRIQTVHSLFLMLLRNSAGMCTYVCMYVCSPNFYLHFGTSAKLIYIFVFMYVIGCVRIKAATPNAYYSDDEKKEREIVCVRVYLNMLVLIYECILFYVCFALGWYECVYVCVFEREKEMFNLQW